MIQIQAPPENVSELQLASYHDLTALVRPCLEKRCNIKAIGANYAPLHLHWAILRENDGVTKLLLENGACADGYGYMSQTPLWLVVWKGSESIVQLMLEGEADIEAKDSEGQTPLCNAAG